MNCTLSDLLESVFRKLYLARLRLLVLSCAEIVFANHSAMQNSLFSILTGAFWCTCLFRYILVTQRLSLLAPLLRPHLA